MRTDRYDYLGHKVNGQLQIDLLIQYSQQNHATPLYCLYNFCDYVHATAHCHCCQRPLTVDELNPSQSETHIGVG